MEVLSVFEMVLLMDSGNCDKDCEDVKPISRSSIAFRVIVVPYTRKYNA